MTQWESDEVATGPSIPPDVAADEVGGDGRVLGDAAADLARHPCWDVAAAADGFPTPDAVGSDPDAVGGASVGEEAVAVAAAG